MVPHGGGNQSVNGFNIIVTHAQMPVVTSRGEVAPKISHILCPYKLYFYQHHHWQQQTKAGHANRKDRPDHGVLSQCN